MEHIFCVQFWVWRRKKLWYLVCRLRIQIWLYGQLWKPEKAGWRKWAWNSVFWRKWGCFFCNGCWLGEIWPQGILATIRVVIFALHFLAGTNWFKYLDWWWEQQPWSEFYWRQLGKEIQDTQIEHDLCRVKKQAACCRPIEMNGRTARMKTL
jgi:hypothetical protein